MKPSAALLYAGTLFLAYKATVSLLSTLKGSRLLTYLDLGMGIKGKKKGKQTRPLASQGGGASRESGQTNTKNEKLRACLPSLISRCSGCLSNSGDSKLRSEDPGDAEVNPGVDNNNGSSQTSAPLNLDNKRSVEAGTCAEYQPPGRSTSENCGVVVPDGCHGSIGSAKEVVPETKRRRYSPVSAGTSVEAHPTKPAASTFADTSSALQGGGHITQAKSEALSRKIYRGVRPPQQQQVTAVSPSHCGLEVSRFSHSFGNVRRETLHLAWAPNGGAQSRRLTWEEVVQLWSMDTHFQDLFSGWLRDCPFRAFYWETPPLSSLTASTTPFEMVCKDDGGTLPLTGNPDAFEDHLRRRSEASDNNGICAFQNLAQDCTLIAPLATETDAHEYCGHLASFLRHAPRHQQRSLWAEVGRAVHHRLHASGEPVWVSTAGNGVPWLHVRLDDRPKYIKHRAYQHFSPLMRNDRMTPEWELPRQFRSKQSQQPCGFSHPRCP